MLANYLIGLREGLEAGIIVGILVAYLKKSGRKAQLRQLWTGIGIAIAVSLGFGAILTWGPYSLTFQAQEILGGTLSLIAVGMVTWMVFWMAKHGRTLANELRNKVDKALDRTAKALVLVGAISVGREGLETALFVWTNVSGGTNSVLGTSGAFLGIATAVGLSWGISRGMFKINLSRFFTWTGLLLVFVAAGVFAYGIGDLQEAGVLPSIHEKAYNLTGIIPPGGWVDSILGGIFNYRPEPTWFQVIGWTIYLFTVLPLYVRAMKRRASLKPARAKANDMEHRIETPTAQNSPALGHPPMNEVDQSPSNKTTKTAVSKVATATATAAVIGVTLTSCIAKADLQSAIPVSITDTTCDVKTSTSPSGAIQFSIKNNGSDTNEFEILASDKLRVVGEKENITANQTVTFAVLLDPGTYYTACKFQQVGAPVGLAAFTVTGTKTIGNTDATALAATAITEYVSYVKSQVAELIPAVSDFTAAYKSGDDETARSLYAKARVPYERIEPTAEAFGDLDPKIDLREVDAVADDLAWNGFHRIEKDLWPPAAGALNSDGKNANENWAASTPAQRAEIADMLVADTAKLHELVTASTFTVSVDQISNGAIALLDEVAGTKISGEEDWWSGTDLHDFAANIQGAKVAFGAVRAIAESKGETGTQLAVDLDAQFTSLERALSVYGSIESGFVDYRTVTAEQRKVLSDEVNALAEPLSKLTHVILGV